MLALPLLLLLLASVAATATATASATATAAAAASAAIAAHLNPLLPKGWHEIRAAVNVSTSQATNYLVTSYYATSATCGGDATTVSGMAFDVCMIGYDTCGKAVSAARYSNPKVAGGYLSYTLESFTGVDCSSPSATYPMTVPTACMGISGAGFQYALATGAEPWKGANKGVVNLIYDSSECGQNPLTWSSISSTFCIATGATCTSPSNNKYFLYSKCSGDVASLTYFSDSACSMPIGGTTLPATTCQAAEQVWTSVTCNN